MRGGRKFTIASCVLIFLAASIGYAVVVEYSDALAPLCTLFGAVFAAYMGGNVGEHFSARREVYGNVDKNSDAG